MLCINKITSSSVVDFAAEELKKYLRMMMPEGGDVKISFNPNAKDGFRLGLMGDFGLDTSDAPDTELDDIIYIDCDTCGGIIAGCNPRSVLLAVYEYLRKNGCRWLMPGVDGEYIPMKEIAPVKYRRKPTMRYRGNCIEGAISQDNLVAYIDFMPKVGLNTFMLQFRIPDIFYDRYYGKSNITRVSVTERVGRDAMVQWTRAAECEMAKRGIMLHSYGHGFTVDPFISTPSRSGWGKADISIFPEDKRDYIAMIDGVREFRCGVPTNTNICMSSEKARLEIAKYVADYAESHSNTDFLNVWLADNYNNHCECEKCAALRPSDFYVTLLNDIDGELTARDLNTRIVFIVYVDTSWAPIREKIGNPERFTLMLAPITRNYSYTLRGDDAAETLPYVRNKLTMPKNLAEYLAYFEEWKKNFDGASVCFEYHFWLPMNYDLSGIRIARRVYEDALLYKERGLDGIIECGSQRTFFPHGLGFYTHARVLFDSSLSFEEITEDYFSHAFGEDWQKFYDYLVSLEKALPFEHLSKVKPSENFYSEKIAESLKSIPEICRVGEELIKAHYNSDVRIRTVSVRILEYYNEFMLKFGEIATAKAKGENDEAQRLYDGFIARYASFEAYLKYYVDMHQTVRALDQLIVCKSTSDTDGDVGRVSVI